MYNDFYNSAYYSTESVADAAAIGTAMMGLYAGIMIFSLILSLISIISYWKIFAKAGKPGWASIVPIYNIVTMIQVAKLPIWYIVLYFVPIANIYALFKVNIEMAKRFGKSSGYGIGMALLAIIFVPMLAFSDSVYEDAVTGTVTNNNFDATNVINNNVENNINTMNNVENTIPAEPANIGIAPINNIEVSGEPANQVVEPINNINENLNNQISVAPVMEENVNPIVTEPVVNVSPNENTNPVASQTSTPVEPAPYVSPANEIPTTAPVFEQPNEVVEESIVPETPVAPIEPTVAHNAFNQAPIMPEVGLNNVVPETIEPTIAPTENNVIEKNNIQTVENIPVQEMTFDGKKLCKNCGSEMPSIVSLCPNCGTDNE